MMDQQSFLEFEKKDLAKLLRRVSFDCHNFSSPDQWEIGKQWGKCVQLERRYNSLNETFPDDRNTHCLISSGDRNCQLNECEPRSESRNVGEEMACEKESEIPCNLSKYPQQMESEIPCNLSKYPQQCNQHPSEVNIPRAEKNETWSPDCQKHSGRVVSRPLISKSPVLLMEDLDDDVAHVAGSSGEASLEISKFHDAEWKQALQGDRCSRFQMNEVTQRTEQGKDECYIASDKCLQTKSERSLGLKNINDQIIKVVTKPARKQGIMGTKTKHRDGAGTEKRWDGKSSSGDSCCLCTDSEHERNGCSLPHPRRCRSRTTSCTGKDEECSDADYATDEPSETEDCPLKPCENLLAKKSSAQVLMGQKEISLATTSRNDYSFRDACRKCGKAFSSCIKSPSHPPADSGERRPPEILIKGIASNYGGELNLQTLSLTSGLVASLFPVFKSETNRGNEKKNLEQAPKMARPEKDRRETPIHHRETSLLAQMKDEQAKAMHLLRRQISKFDTTRTQASPPLEEGKNKETLKRPKDKAVFQKHTSAMKEEEEVIWMLKKQMADLQEEFRRNKIRWHAAHGKLRNQLEALTKQNLELRDELRVTEPQRMETQRRHGDTAIISRRSETPLSEAILRGMSSQEYLEERPWQDSHKALTRVHLGRKGPLEDTVHKDRNAEGTRRSLQRSDSWKSTRGEPRARSPSKTLNNRSVTPTCPRTPCQTPFEPLKATYQLNHSQPQSSGRNTPMSVSSQFIHKDTTPSLYIKGICSSTSCISEDATTLNSLNNDILNSTSLTNEEIQVMENLGHKRVQESKKPSEQLVSTPISKRNSVPATGRKTPEGNLLTFVDAEKTVSLRKPPLSRYASPYIESKAEEGEIKEEVEYPDGKVKQLFTDGRRVTTYPNGTKMEISMDRKTTTVTFYNGDVKKILPDQTEIYFYANAEATRTIYPDGLEVLQFPNDQIEKYHPDGTEEIIFPDLTVKHLYDGGLEETIFPDGTVVKVEKSGVKTIQFRNGQKEIQTAQSKRRVYPDGTVKTVYANGHLDTKNFAGRV